MAWGGIGSGRSFGGGREDALEVDSDIGGGLLDIAGDDYMGDFGDDFFGGDDDVAGDYVGLIGDDRDYDDYSVYQGMEPTATIGVQDKDWDTRNIGTKIADWFEKHNPIIEGLNKIGIDAKLDRTLGTGNELDDEGNRIGESDRDDSAAEYACAAAGGTWDGGSCVMPSDNGDNGDNGDDGGDIDYGAFGRPDPFASINRKRQMFYHPMMGGTAHGNVYDPYSGERPDYIDENIWDYKPPRAGAELKNWAGDLRKWASGD